MPERFTQKSKKMYEVTVPASTIPADVAVTLPGLFRERVKRSPDATAYRYFDQALATWKDSTWHEMECEVARWQLALQKESLEKGDRVAIMAKNCREWVMFDQAALGLGLVIVPLSMHDRTENAAYILGNCGAKLLVIGEAEQWSIVNNNLCIDAVNRIISIEKINSANHVKLIALQDWLPNETENSLITDPSDPDALATIVYTSGTTGNPKGVMLSHRNILSNAYGGLRSFYMTESDLFLSFLPLSHTLERTIGYYLPMMSGSTVAFSRSILHLAEDLIMIKPTAIISVPRIYERVYARIKKNIDSRSKLIKKLFYFSIEVGWRRFEYTQGRAKYSLSLLFWPLIYLLFARKIQKRFGGRLRGGIVGGAPVPPGISRIFIALGIPMLQGYGLTEASPCLSANRIDHNIPASIGPIYPDAEVCIGENDELLAKGDNVMLGYWDYPEETDRVIDSDGWLHTGDQARIEDDYIYITGRIKEIIVLSTGEKVSPSDMELAIAQDAFFEQVMILGEARPYLTAIAVLDKDLWKRFAKDYGYNASDFTKPEIEKLLLKRLSHNLQNFPGYAQIRRMTCTIEPWTIEQDLITPTLKVKRRNVMEKYKQSIEAMYKGHTI